MIHNSPNTFIIIGRSGCGKGTQSDLLQEYLKREHSQFDIFSAEAGAQFRALIDKGSHTGALAKEINERGELQPAFLSVWVWADLFINGLDDTKHLIVDGSPRKLNEAKIFDEALSFYKRKNLYIIFINVSREWASERLMERKRDDDTREDIDKRLNWFDTDVAPVIEFFKNNANYNFLEINGEQNIEAVHSEILEKLKG